MEVHAHSHSERKKWTHYLWEFLMLFLAVFCGFLAEYKLEHVIEHQREKKFMQSMVQDLHSDTARAFFALRVNAERLEKFDSLLGILDQPAIEKMDTRKAYYLHRRYLTNWAPLEFARNTFTQLKNGGNMRMIRNQKVVDTLNWLDAFMLGMDNQKNSVDRMMDMADETASGIFNSGYFREDGKSLSVGYILTTSDPPVFMSRDISVFQKYANKVDVLLGTMRSYTQQLKYYVDLSTRVIQLIRKEYHFQ